ncbi:MAG: homoserine dehydrogenase [Spirochaetales bacterium]|nr:homoserine dehydrogenase [Spirochaetales bacterium]
MAREAKRCGIVLAGCGTIGGATAIHLVRDADFLERKLGMRLELLKIVDVDFSHAKELGLDGTLFEKDFDKAIASQDVDIVVELIGGTTIARDRVERALAAGKHVVTANKALLAEAGNQLFALARENGVSILFEASCAGGIPVVRALYDGLAANRIDALYGIVNGTCNYVLTQMTERGESYAAALAGAQKLGFAEKDPTLDVSGRDSAHKLAILSAIAFAQPIDQAGFSVEGIDNLDLCDVCYGGELGYVLKLLAIARREGDGLYAAVKPAFIPKSHPLAWVSGPFNAVSVYGSATGHTMYYGRGAGPDPTASAVVADVISLALGTGQIYFDSLALWPDRAAKNRVLPRRESRTRFYVRLTAADESGVLAKIAAVFGRFTISISSVLQKEPAGESTSRPGVPVVITTHPAPESAVCDALREVDALTEILDKSVCLTILDEHQEFKAQ